MLRFAHRLVIGLIAAVLWQAAASAQDARQNEAGKFDFYVLALSWSPSYCEARGERAPQMQCGERPYAFVVHGLWPQYERGFPEYCQQPSPRLSRNLVDRMLDLMPAPRLVYNEWDKHGTCSGLSQNAYFENVRKARALIKIPADYTDVRAPLMVTPDDVEEAFTKANPGLTRAGVAVTCGGTRLSEVRICLTRELRFRDCADVDRRACPRDKLVMPPVRGGKS